MQDKFPGCKNTEFAGTCTIVNNYSGTLYMEIMKAVLGLEDGQFVTGEGFGVEGECSGELVFNTQMTGYMESLTDPSYFGQILMFTFPLIGNYGVDPQNFQNQRICALGCIANEICEKPGAKPSIRSFFEENGLLRDEWRRYTGAHHKDPGSWDYAGSSRRRE